MRKYIDLIESANANIQILSGQDTINFINENDPSLWESKRIRYLLHSEARKEMHVIITVGNRIAAIGGMQTNPSDIEQLWIKFISVDPAFRGRGYARMALEQIYQYASAHHQKLAPGSFTEDGERLAHLHDEFDAKYPEVAYTRNAKGQYVNDKGQIIC